MGDTDLAFRATLDGSGFATGAQALNGQLNDLGMRTNTASANLGGLGTVLGTMANPMTAAALGITAVGGALASSVGTAASFEAAMSRVASVAGASQSDLQMMSDAAREAGASTVFSASQAADAMYFLASSGMNAQQMITSLPDTLNLASAGGLELARSAEIMTGTLAQFGLQAESAGRVANVLAAASAAGNTDVEQLGQAFANAGAAAAGVGMSLEETAAAITIFSNANIKGAEAGTALKSILGSLMTPSKEAADALAGIGLSVSDINPMLHSYDEIMSTLAEHHMTASDAAKIFGQNMYSNALVAVNGAKDFEKLENKITGTNKAAEMSAQMTDNLKGAWDEFSSATEEAAIALGNTLIPALTNTIEFMTWGVTAATNFGKALYEWGEQSDKALAGFADWIEKTGWFGTQADAEKAAYIISDTYVESTAEGIKAAKEITADAIGENLGGADAQKAAAKAGETIAETFAKADAAWIKEHGWEAEMGRTRQAIYDTEEFGKEKKVIGYTDWTYTGYTTPTPAEAWKPTTPPEVKLEAGWDKGEVIRLITQRAGALSEYIDSEGNKRLLEASTSKYVDYANQTFKGVIQKLMNNYDYTEQEAAALVWSSKGDTSFWRAMMQRDAQGLEDFKAQYADIESQSKELLAGRTERIIGEETAAHRQEQLDAWLKSLPLDMQRVSIAAKSLMFDVQQSMTAIATPESKINPEPWTEVFNALSQDVIKDTDWPKIDDALEIMLKSGADPALVSQLKDYLKSHVEQITDIPIELRYKLNWEEFWLKNKDAALKGLTDSQMSDIFDMGNWVKTAGPGIQEAWDIIWQGLESPSKEMEPLVTDAIKSMIGIIPNFTSEMADALITLYVGGIEKAKPTIVDALTGITREINVPKISDVLSDPNLQKKISDLPDFLENVFQPALKKSFDDQYAITRLGYDESISQTTAWVASIERIYSEHANWFQNYQRDLLYMYANNQISADTLMRVWDAFENKSTKTVDNLNNQAVGYNQLQKAMEDCAECAISDFGEWQEAQDNLFMGSYIGEGGEGYLAWYTQQAEAIAETQRAMKAVGGAVLGKDYTTSPLLSYQLDIDTSPAENSLKIIQTNIKMSDIKMPVDLATETAEASKATLQTSIESTKPAMEIQLETSAAMAQATALYSAISSLSPVVYVQVVPLISAADIAAMISAELGGAGA